MARLGALADLDLDHLDLGLARLFGKALGVEAAIVVAAAEVARADLPNQIAAVLAVVAADAALARVVGEAVHLGALVQRQDGVGRQRAEAHGRDVEHAGVVGLGAGRDALQGLARAPADPDAEVVRVDLGRLHGVVDPLVALGAHVQLGAEWPHVGLALGALVDHRALRAREGLAVLHVALDEVLADLRADELQPKAHVAQDGIVAQDGVARLAQVAQAYQREQAGHGQQHRWRPAEAEGRQPQRAGQRKERTQRQRAVAHAVDEKGVKLHWNPDDRRARRPQGGARRPVRRGHYPHPGAKDSCVRAVMRPPLRSSFDSC